MPIIDSNSCHLWHGAKTSAGYGVRCVQGINRYVHRLVWETINGPIPEGLFVCHHCDNPSCINIKHLFLGTPADNVHDMMAKHRDRFNSWRPPRVPKNVCSAEKILCAIQNITQCSGQKQHFAAIHVVLNIDIGAVKDEQTETADNHRRKRIARTGAREMVAH